MSQADKTTVTLDPSTAEALMGYTLRLADDALVLGHRLSEWVSNGPFLEEDIALANTALDYIGRARMFYGHAAQISTDMLACQKTEDDLVYLRNEREYQNHLIVELPIGDFAFTMARQLLIDTYSVHYLDALKKSADLTLAAIAEKAIKESRYHLRRSQDWILRLGDGTDESHRRVQTAINELWDYIEALFEVDALELGLIEQGIAVNPAAFKATWLAEITASLEQATLSVPTTDNAIRGGRQGYHTENLGHLLTELQFVHRSYPDCQW